MSRTNHPRFQSGAVEMGLRRAVPVPRQRKGHCAAIQTEFVAWMRSSRRVQGYPPNCSLAFDGALQPGQSGKQEGGAQRVLVHQFEVTALRLPAPIDRCKCGSGVVQSQRNQSPQLMKNGLDGNPARNTARAGRRRAPMKELLRRYGPVEPGVGPAVDVERRPRLDLHTVGQVKQRVQPALTV